MRLSTAKKRYRNEWIVFQFTDPRRDAGRLLVHAKDRHTLFKRLTSHAPKATGIYITFAGRIIPKDVSIVLLA